MDDDTPCRGCILTTHNSYSAGLEAAPGTSSAKTTSAGGGGGGYTHKYDQSLLPFAGSDMSCRLRHVDAERVEAIEGLLAIHLDEGRGLGKGRDQGRGQWGGKGGEANNCHGHHNHLQHIDRNNDIRRLSVAKAI